MRLTSEQINAVEADLKSSCAGFSKKNGYWNKLNGFCLTRVRLHIGPDFSHYQVWVQSSILHNENPGITDRRFDWSFARQAAFPDFIADVKRQTLAREPVRIDDILDEFSRRSANQIYRPPYIVESLAVVRFYRDGFTAALAELDHHRSDWDLWSPSIREGLGGSWAAWTDGIAKSLDKSKIECARDAYLVKSNLKLRDFCIAAA